MPLMPLYLRWPTSVSALWLPKVTDQASGLEDIRRESGYTNYRTFPGLNRACIIHALRARLIPADLFLAPLRM